MKTTNEKARRDLVARSRTPIKHVIFYNLRSSPLEYLAACYAARRLGYGILLITDQKHFSLPKGLVSEIQVINTADIEASVSTGIELARRYKVAGVTTWSDKDVITVAELAQRLNLPGASVEAATTARNKHLMRQSLSAYPELIPRHALVTSWKELIAAANDIGFPAILKPVSGGGSAGIYEIRSVADLRPAFKDLSALTQPSTHQLFLAAPSQMIYEEFLNGTEHSVEGFVYNGQVQIVGITDKTTLPPHHTEIRHIFPSSLDNLSQKKVDTLTKTVVSAFNLNNCAFHLECKIEGDRVRLVECAARIGGGYITSHLVPLATGYDVYANVIRTVTGEKPESMQDQLGMHAGMVRIIPEQEGILDDFPGLISTLRLSGVEHVCLDRGVGETIKLPPHDWVGHMLCSVITRSPTSIALSNLLDRVSELMCPTMR